MGFESGGSYGRAPLTDDEHIVDAKCNQVQSSAIKCNQVQSPLCVREAVEELLQLWRKPLAQRPVLKLAAIPDWTLASPPCPARPEPGARGALGTPTLALFLNRGDGLRAGYDECARTVWYE